MQDDIFIHCFAKIPGIGSEKLRKILTHFKNAESAWKSDSREFLHADLSEKLVKNIEETRKNIHPEEEQEILERWNIRLIPFGNLKYPELLAEIPNPPAILYFRGNTSLNEKPLITIVGTRRPTEYGLGIAREFALELAKSGIIIVSGMALGIDKEAHKGALEGGGETLAVLGNGLEDASIAPRTHLDLAHAICLHGALLSDYPPGTEASEFTFPARNRIMAGVSLGTIVIEASEKSGTLITANLALDYNREVFAVPGSIYSEHSRGPHALIRNGATLVRNITDILDALPLVKKRESFREETPENLSKEEHILLRTLGSDTLHVDTIVKHSTLGTSTALSTLAFLEMKGLVKNIGNMHYIRTYTTNFHSSKNSL